MLSFDAQRPLPAAPGETYRGLAFDGARYYLTVQGRARVAVVDGELGLAEVLDTGRPYTALCYDSERDCFWACSDRDRTVLFRLDRDFQEVGRLEPRREGRRPGPITGVSFCPLRGVLAVSCGGRLLEADPEEGTARLLREERGGGLILGVACSFPYLLYSVLREGEVRFVLTAGDGQVLAETTAPEVTLATAFLFLPESRDLRLLSGRQGGVSLRSARLEGEGAEPGLNGAPEAWVAALESAARLDAALARVLRAEGERLRDLVHRSAPAREVEVAGRALRRTLRAAARLEAEQLRELTPLAELWSRADALEEGGPPEERGETQGTDETGPPGENGTVLDREPPGP